MCAFFVLLILFQRLIAHKFKVGVAALSGTCNILTAHTDKRSRMSLVSDIAICLVGKIGAIKRLAHGNEILSVQGVIIGELAFFYAYTKPYSGAISYTNALHKRVIELQAVAYEHS